MKKVDHECRTFKLFMRACNILFHGGTFQGLSYGLFSRELTCGYNRMNITAEESYFWGKIEPTKTANNYNEGHQQLDGFNNIHMTMRGMHQTNLVLL